MITFGPVSSRRLGKSLGINNIASRKACSYSCLYCQVGITGRTSIERIPFYDPETLVKAVQQHLEKLAPEFTPDYLTFVANGEPTLDIFLGKEIDLLKRFQIPIAVITNASLLYLPAVRSSLQHADWVSVKVDTVDPPTWKTINQPADVLQLKKILAGVVRFSQTFKGRLNTETMLVEGVNDDPDQVSGTTNFIASLHPARSYLAIPIRPPATRTVRPPNEKKLLKAWQIFQAAGLSTSLLNGFEGTDTGTTGNAYQDILSITAVHPMREDALIELLRRDQADSQVVHALIRQGLIKPVIHDGQKFYVRCYHPVLH